MKAKQIAEMMASTSVTPDEVRVVSPPKRMKLDIPLIELDQLIPFICLCLIFLSRPVGI